MSALPRGLPQALPPGERLLWQGAPDWRMLARHAFHIRKLALYFGLIVAWVAVSSATGGAPATGALRSVLLAAAIGAVPVALVAAYAWAVARSTVYTLTDRRIVVRAGLALPLTINLPFACIAAADLNARSDGSGDISVSLIGNDRLAYFVLWPHARPWRLARAEPTLRAIPDAQAVAHALSRALAASANMEAPVLANEAEAGVRAPHATIPA